MKSTESIAVIAEKALFRPRSRLWELHDLHVPFDVLAHNRNYEQMAITRIIEGTCVAVNGDLRRVLAAAHEAAEHAAADGAHLIMPPHIRFGIAQWQ